MSLKKGAPRLRITKEIYDFLGSPEGDYAISYATIYCATAPKSNAAYLAHNLAIEVATKTTQLNPPKNILNAPTEIWTIRCVSVRRDTNGDPVDGYAKFVAQGS